MAPPPKPDIFSVCLSENHVSLVNIDKFGELYAVQVIIEAIALLAKGNITYNAAICAPFKSFE